MPRRGIIIQRLDETDDWGDGWPVACELCDDGTASHRAVVPNGIDNDVLDVCEDCVETEFGTEAA